MVSRVANLSGTEIRVGDSPADQFVSTALTVNSIGDVQSAGSLVQRTKGSINVSTNAQLIAELIQVGTGGLNEANFGSLTLRATTNAFINEDSATLLTGENQAELLRLHSTGAIEDTLAAQTLVSRVANLSGTEIRVSDNGRTPEFIGNDRRFGDGNDRCHSCDFPSRGARPTG